MKSTPTLALPLRGRGVFFCGGINYSPSPSGGARRGFEVHATEPPSARSDAADRAGTVGMGVVHVVHLSVFSVISVANIYRLKPWYSSPTSTATGLLVFFASAKATEIRDASALLSTR